VLDVVITTGVVDVNALVVELDELVDVVDGFVVLDVLELVVAVVELLDARPPETPMPSTLVAAARRALRCRRRRVLQRQQPIQLVPAMLHCTPVWSVPRAPVALVSGIRSPRELV
jgi:hypothetical protein